MKCVKGTIGLWVVFPLLLCAASSVFASPDDAESQGPALTEREKAIHLLSRLAFGPRPGDVGLVVDQGWQVWLEEQLAPESIPDEGIDGALEQFETLGMDARDLAKRFKKGDKQGKPSREVRSAVILRAVGSERQLQEVMVYFWRNHFNVDAEKGIVKQIIPAWDRDVIRAHVFGKFEPFLMASAKHPAMLEYLDNVVSQKPLTETELKYLKPGTRSEARFLRQRGLNENYARELLELHTMGVDNYYKQNDVRELARVLTGWTFETDPKKPLEFLFRPKVHDNDSKKVLRIRVHSRVGIEEGEGIVRGLARHKGASQFIAMKMCRYLVSDTPDKTMVKDIAKVFRMTKGNLLAVTRAVILHPRFFDRSNYRAKFKTPFEFVASALRAVGARNVKPNALVKSLRLMSQPIYGCEDPTGYYDQAEAWRDPGVMINRWRFCLEFTRGGIPGVKVPESFYAGLLADCKGVDRARWPEIVGKRIVPAGLGLHTLEVLRDKTQHAAGADKNTIRQLVGLVLGAPEFQQQ